MFTLGAQALEPVYPARYKTACTQGTGVYFSAQIQGLNLVLEHRQRSRILAWIID